MSTVYKAQRRTIYIGDLPLEVAMLPDGSYRLSQTQATEIVDTCRNSMLRFYRSKYVKAFLGADFQCYSFSEEILISGAPRPINPVTFEVACLYWTKCAAEGNLKARAIVVALVKQSLYDRADIAFGVKCDPTLRTQELAEDLSDAGITRIAAAYHSLESQTPESSLETQTERELKLKIRLAELELEREKLQQDRHSNPFPATEIDKVGIPPWQVIPWAQKTLGCASPSDVARLIHQLGYGYKTEHWFKLKIIGELWVMPCASFDSLKEAVEKFKLDRN